MIILVKRRQQGLRSLIVIVARAARGSRVDHAQIRIISFAWSLSKLLELWENAPKIIS